MNTSIAGDFLMVFWREMDISMHPQETSQMLKIDTTNKTCSIAGSSVDSNHRGCGWEDAIMGNDGSVYCPPMNATHTLKYDPYTDLSSLVGNDFGNGTRKWKGGAIASDSLIYYIPHNASRVLAIYPFRQFKENLASNIEQYPERLGLIFAENDRVSRVYHAAEMKYGIEKVFGAMVDILPPTNELFTENGLLPFMVAGSYPENDLSVIYHLLRQVPSIMSSTNL